MCQIASYIIEELIGIKLKLNYLCENVSINFIRSLHPQKLFVLINLSVVMSYLMVQCKNIISIYEVCQIKDNCKFLIHLFIFYVGTLANNINELNYTSNIFNLFLLNVKVTYGVLWH